MEVTIHSNVTGALGVVIISTDPDQTIGSLIRAFCNEKGISRRSDFVLTNCRQEVLQRNRKLTSYGIQNGEELYLSISESDEWPCGCNQWWILAFVAFMIGAVGIAAISYTKSGDYTPKYTYGVGLDAGSSHTTLYVYRWPVSKNNGTGIVYQVYSCPEGNDTMRAISSFVDDPSLAGQELQPCLNKAKRFVPSEELSRTPIFLGATAGMRLLNLSNSSLADKIMTSVRDTIRTYPFLIKDMNKQVRIIQGVEEGVYSWITTNYLSGKFGFQPWSKIETTARSLYSELANKSLLGALDMGGASTQITYVPEHADSLHHGYNATVSLYGTEYSVYTQSYQCYGLNEAYRRYLAQLVMDSKYNYNQTIEEPCSEINSTYFQTYDVLFQVPCTLGSHDDAAPQLKGKNFTFRGSSNTVSCRNHTLKLFNFTASCRYPSCTFDGVYQPPLYGSFLGFSGFYSLMSFLNLTSWNSTIEDFARARDSYCTFFSPPSKYNPCFQAHVIYNLLVDGYNFSDANWADLSFKKQVNGADLGWILGMMINATNVIPVSVKTEAIPLGVFVVLVILFSAFVFLSIGFAFHARRQNRRRYNKYQPVTTAYGAI